MRGGGGSCSYPPRRGGRRDNELTPMHKFLMASALLFLLIMVGIIPL